MLLSDFKKISIDGVEMKQLFINDTQVWKSGYKNWVKYSTESDGKTIYNGGLGYKTGYRVRSGGAEGENSNAICTGFIPYKKGDLLRIIPQFTGVNSQNTINFYDSGFANLGQYNDNGSFYGICTGGGWNVATEQDGITTVDVTGANGAAGIAYIRITHIYVAPGLTSSHTAYVQDPETDFIVTVNEEIAAAEPVNQFVATNDWVNKSLTSSGGAWQNRNGYWGVEVNGISLSANNPYIIRISGVTPAVDSGDNAYGRIALLNASGGLVKFGYITTSILKQDGDSWYLDLHSISSDASVTTCRLAITLNTNRTAISLNDCANLFVEFEPLNG